MMTASSDPPTSDSPTSDPPASEIAPGVRELDHTADVGLIVRAGDPEELFRRAALGMARLMRGPTGGGAGPQSESRDVGDDGTARGPAQRSVALTSDSLDLLLVGWLNELLYLDEVEGFVFEDASFEELESAELKALVSGRIVHEVAERQLKGVTYHGLRLEPHAGGWEAEVIFDI